MDGSIRKSELRLRGFGREGNAAVEEAILAIPAALGTCRRRVRALLECALIGTRSLLLTHSRSPTPSLSRSCTLSLACCLSPLSPPLLPSLSPSLPLSLLRALSFHLSLSRNLAHALPPPQYRAVTSLMPYGCFPDQGAHDKEAFSFHSTSRAHRHPLPSSSSRPGTAPPARHSRVSVSPTRLPGWGLGKVGVGV